MEAWGSANASCCGWPSRVDSDPPFQLLQRDLLLKCRRDLLERPFDALLPRKPLRAGSPNQPPRPPGPTSPRPLSALRTRTQQASHPWIVHLDSIRSLRAPFDLRERAGCLLNWPAGGARGVWRERLECRRVKETDGGDARKRSRERRGNSEGKGVQVHNPKQVSA